MYTWKCFGFGFFGVQLGQYFHHKMLRQPVSTEHKAIYHCPGLQIVMRSFSE